MQQQIIHRQRQLTPTASEMELERVPYRLTLSSFGKRSVEDRCGTGQPLDES